MNQPDNERVGLKFWIAALAFSILLLASTFAMMAYYLADIESNTIAALNRAEIVAERLSTLDKEISAIHHHIIMTEKANQAAAQQPQPAGIAVPAKPEPIAPAPTVAAPVSPTQAIQPPPIQEIITPQQPVPPATSPAAPSAAPPTPAAKP
jgi:hypothetical protein